MIRFTMDEISARIDRRLLALLALAVAFIGTAGMMSRDALVRSLFQSPKSAWETAWSFRFETLDQVSRHLIVVDGQGMLLPRPRQSGRTVLTLRALPDPATVRATLPAVLQAVADLPPDHTDVWLLIYGTQGPARQQALQAAVDAVDPEGRVRLAYEIPGSASDSAEIDLYLARYSSRWLGLTVYNEQGRFQILTAGEVQSAPSIRRALQDLRIVL
jgi:hypothetical protein